MKRRHKKILLDGYNKAVQGHLVDESGPLLHYLMDPQELYSSIRKVEKCTGLIFTEITLRQDWNQMRYNLYFQHRKVVKIMGISYTKNLLKKELRTKTITWFNYLMKSIFTINEPDFSVYITGIGNTFRINLTIS